ncbi:MAG: hypothetical protein IJ207_05105 [Treponema sp.]|uniref:hypothetical protein n=1 Tax=Treponema sp. TaxID=166 RepID=UPI0025ED5879|nr:hypothetical protein [Treponema sp.]MBQ9281560.1 hypothetical protein [Treponema sp.]
MKALKNFFMVLLATAILFGFASCSSDDDDSEEQNISSSTNENDPLKGTTWVLVESGITQYELIFDSAAVKTGTLTFYIKSDESYTLSKK